MGIVPDRPQSIDSLTSLRFFAALWVVLLHFGRGFATRGTWGDRLIGSGTLGVTFFFVLSGFVLSYVYAGRDLKSPEGRRSFLVARVARIVPLYAIGVLAAIPYSLPKEGHVVGFMMRLLTRATFLHAWIPTRAMGVNSPSWTISVEAAFYLAFPLLLGHIMRWRIERLLGVCLAVAVIGTAVPVLLPIAGRPNDDALYQLGVYFPLWHLGSFLVGMTVARLFVKSTFLSSPRWAWIAIAIGLAPVLVAVSFVEVSQVPFLNVAFFAPGFGLALLGFARVDRRGSILRLPLLLFLGEASFALYILQEPIMRYLEMIEKECVGYVSDTPYNEAGRIALLTGLSCLAYRYVETPLRSILRQRLSPKRS